MMSNFVNAVVVILVLCVFGNCLAYPTLNQDRYRDWKDLDHELLALPSETQTFYENPPSSYEEPPKPVRRRLTTDIPVALFALRNEIRDRNGNYRVYQQYPSKFNENDFFNYKYF